MKTPNIILNTLLYKDNKPLFGWYYFMCCKVEYRLSYENISIRRKKKTQSDFFCFSILGLGPSWVSGGLVNACENKPSLPSFNWAGHTYSTVQRAGCQSQPGLRLSLRLSGHVNHKALPVTDQDGESKLVTEQFRFNMPKLYQLLLCVNLFTAAIRHKLECFKRPNEIGGLVMFGDFWIYWTIIWEAWLLSLSLGAQPKSCLLSKHLIWLLLTVNYNLCCTKSGLKVQNQKRALSVLRFKYYLPRCHCDDTCFLVCLLRLHSLL